MFKDYVVVQEKQAGLNRLRVHGFASGAWQEVAFPEPVYSAFAAGTPEYDSTLFRYSYQSLITPSSVYDYDMQKGESRLLKREEVLGGYDPQRYASERLWAMARDGAAVPISIVYPKSLVRDGRAPLWLYAYGSYGFGMGATFDSKRLSLLERGIPFAIAHIRGGDEMGETWHDDGMLMKKKNTFFDFIDCAVHLVQEKWTAADRLLIEGGSAGGLLMGAVVNVRPDLFRAAHAAVPFVDVINTMMDASLPLTIGEYLEWGNPNEKPAFDYMLSYSPYDNLARKAYPALLVTTSYNDSQVMYWEPAKYVAKLRTLKTDANPLLLKTKMQPAGHGGASGRYDALKDRAFEVAWMLKQVGDHEVGVTAARALPPAEARRGHHAVAAGLLRGVERAVGRREQRLRVAAVSRPDRDAEAGGERDARALEHEAVLLERRAQPLRRPVRVLGVGAGQDHHELLAAVAGRLIALAQVLVEQPRERAQRRVARRMAVGVVELLEVVEVEDHEPEAAGRAAVLVRDRGAQELGERAPVVEPGQAVAHRQLALLLLVLDQLDRGGRLVGEDLEHAARRGVEGPAPAGEHQRAERAAARPQRHREQRLGAARRLVQHQHRHAPLVARDALEQVGLLGAAQHPGGPGPLVERHLALQELAGPAEARLDDVARVEVVAHHHGRRRPGSRGAAPSAAPARAPRPRATSIASRCEIG